VGAGVLAVVASIAALTILCLFQSPNVVWQRLLIAAVLAAALTSLHWLAAVGTEFRLKPGNEYQGVYESHSVVPVIVLVSSTLTALDNVQLTCAGCLWNYYPSSGLIPYLDSDEKSCQKSTASRISGCSLRS
jgi:NO-binding membrane sensor protein with MHYT domain